MGFTRALIENLPARGCIDPSRVYATGMSNGGFFSHRLACEAADVIAAVAPVAGVLALDPSSCTPSRPISILHLHGTGDPLVPYDGGGLADSPSVEASIAGWLDRNGCVGAPTVTLCTIEGAGHCWPGQPCRVLGDLGESTTDIDANEAIWRMFSNVRLP